MSSSSSSSCVWGTLSLVLAMIHLIQFGFASEMLDEIVGNRKCFKNMKQDSDKLPHFFSWLTKDLRSEVEKTFTLVLISFLFYFITLFYFTCFHKNYQKSILVIVAITALNLILQTVIVSSASSFPYDDVTSETFWKHLTTNGHTVVHDDCKPIRDGKDAIVWTSGLNVAIQCLAALYGHSFYMYRKNEL